MRACVLWILYLCVCCSGSKGDKIEQVPESSLDTYTWMGSLEDECLLSMLSIPGTHDSGAKGSILGMANAQDLTLEEQLGLGVRCFDIRLKDAKEGLEIQHGIVSFGLSFENDVLPVFRRYLEKYPTETLVVSLKDENCKNTEVYVDEVWRVLNSDVMRPFVVEDFKANLTLGECRGKILFLHRYNLWKERYVGGEFAPGGWKNSATFETKIWGNGDRMATCVVEDEYESYALKDSQKKVDAVMANVRQARTSTDTDWYITFVSATKGLTATPEAFADKVNQPVADAIGALGKGKCGFVLMDYAGKTEGRQLVQAVINSNFKVSK